jgi:MFS family permease
MAEDNREVASEPVAPAGMFAPLRLGIFGRIWTASLFSNFGTLIQGVGAAWAMTQLTGRADMVALVQTATFAPMMLFSLPAGAIADSYDRRKVALVALGIAISGATGLSLITIFHLLSPALLLLFCFIVGTGTALFSPAWQASVGEQVPPRVLPQAIALNSISYNIARSFGPAIGGVLVALLGVLSAFVFNAIAYLPMISVMYMWKRSPEKSRLPREAIGRAMISGARYAIHSPPIRTVALRTLLIGMIGSANSALMPLVAHSLLHGDARLYGILLGCVGIGAVIGAVSIGRIRAGFDDERSMNLCLAVVGVCYAGIGFSRNAPLTCALLIISGAGWMVAMAMCNISIQVSSPRWVTARALAAYTSAICAGMAIGGWGWGKIAAAYGTDIAMIACGIALVASIGFGLVLRMPELEEQRDHGLALTDPDTKLDVTGRSGPVILTVTYRVPLDKAREFYAAMSEMEAIRHRTGAYGWSLSRDVGDPELWVERYHTPTWHDYLRQRTRLTAADMAAWDRARAFHKGPEPIGFRRLLERPYGSVRWSEDVPDHGIIVPLPPPQSS